VDWVSVDKGVWQSGVYRITACPLPDGYRYNLWKGARLLYTARDAEEVRQWHIEHC